VATLQPPLPEHRETTRARGPRSASTTPIGSTRTVLPTDTDGAWDTPATNALFSMARAAFKACYCSVLWLPGTQDEQTSRTCAPASANDLASSGNCRS
jgi:hypothetical protein